MFSVQTQSPPHSTFGRTSARFPPELLLKIFYYLTPPPSDEYQQLPVDLLAASLVSREWNEELTPLISIDLNRFLTNLTNPRTLPDLDRLVSLTKDARKLGVPCFPLPHNLILQGRIFLESHIEHCREVRNYEPRIADALASLLSSLPKCHHFTELELHYYYLSRNHPSLLTRAISVLAPKLPHITSLSLDNDNAHMDISMPINTLIDPFTNKLTTLLLSNVNLDYLTSYSLQQCRLLRRAHFRGISIAGLQLLLPFWPDLEDLTLEHSIWGSRRGSFLEVLVQSAPMLARLEVVDRQTEWFVVTALHRCPRITELRVTGNQSATDQLVRLLVPSIARLRVLSLEGCSGIEGRDVFAMLPEPVETGLEVLRLVNMDQIDPAFVTGMVRVSPRLRSIIMPRRFAQVAAFMDVLTEAGFVADPTARRGFGVVRGNLVNS